MTDHQTRSPEIPASGLVRPEKIFDASDVMQYTYQYDNNGRMRYVFDALFLCHIRLIIKLFSWTLAIVIY